MSPKVPFSRYAAYFGLAAVVCAVDLISKKWMFAHLGMPSGHTQWLIDGVFGFQTSLNEGALFGMGQGMALVFAALSVGAAVGIVVWLFPVGAARDWLLTIALALVTAGIFGNLYDRLGLPGLTWDGRFGSHSPGEHVYAVRDFILIMIGRWPWPTFNVADMGLVSGAILLGYHAFFGKRTELEDEAPACE